MSRASRAMWMGGAAVAGIWTGLRTCDLTSPFTSKQWVPSRGFKSHEHREVGKRCKSHAGFAALKAARTFPEPVTKAPRETG